VKFTTYSKVIFRGGTAPIITGKVPFCDVFFSSPAIPNMGDWSLDCILYGDKGHKLFGKIKNTQRRRTWEMIVEKSVDELMALHRRTGTQHVIPESNFADTNKIP
jgi:hypothetical protein